MSTKKCAGNTLKAPDTSQIIAASLALSRSAEEIQTLSTSSQSSQLKDSSVSTVPAREDGHLSLLASHLGAPERKTLFVAIGRWIWGVQRSPAEGPSSHHPISHVLSLDTLAPLSKLSRKHLLSRTPLPTLGGPHSCFQLFYGLHPWHQRAQVEHRALLYSCKQC